MKGINTAGQALHPLPAAAFRGKREPSVRRGIEPFVSSLAQVCPMQAWRDFAPFVNKGEQERLSKELRQAGILASIESNSVFLSPEPGKYKQQSPDAVLNGIPFEFRNVTGKDEKVERRFSHAKEKGDNLNVYLNIDTGICEAETRRRIALVLDRHPEYTGKIVISWRDGKPIFFDTDYFR